MRFLQQRLHIQPRAFATIFGILFLLLIVSGYFEFRSRRRSVIDLLSENARNLTQIIQRSAVNSILSYDLLEEELAQRLISSLKMLDHLEAERPIDDEFLREYALENGFHRIHIFNREGERLLSSYAEHKEFGAPFEIEPLLTDSSDEMVLGFRYARYAGGQNYGVAIRRSAGGAILGNVDAQRLLAFRREVGIGAMLQNIAQDQGIHYVAIQDSLGILAASQGVDSLSALRVDSFLQEIEKSGSYNWRIAKGNSEKYFECAMPFMVEQTSYGIIRIAMSYQPIRRIEIVAMRQGFIRLLAVMVLGLILFGYSIATQNIRLLETEKKRITTEVYALQSDLRQKEKLSAMGELAAGVAHEIRNPLNAISMTVQRMALEFSSEGEEEQRQLIQTVRQEIKRISDIIQQFLQFARPQPLTLEVIDVAQLIESVVRLYHEKCRQAGIIVMLDLAKGIRSRLDREKMTQALINLFENAIQAMEPGGAIRIHLARHQSQIEIRFSDSGIGIDPGDLPKIFNLYFTTKADGTGFGLAQVYQIVSEHGGSIQAESQPGKGTVFIVNLPKA